MNLATFERAQVAAFAYRQARHTGSLDCMKAVCYLLRNRVKAGWGDGSWLSVIEAAGAVAGNSLASEPSAHFSASDRLLQLIMRDVDDIYLGQEHWDDAARMVVMGDDAKKPGALYYSFVDRDPSSWFVENIVRKPAEHAHVGNIGPMMLFL
jgi:hypothetical protein